MGNEMSKANVRRAKDWRYANRWFVGKGLDIGCGTDPLKVDNQDGFFQIASIDGYDKELGNGDAQILTEIPDAKYDFVVSSHCLEHMINPEVALRNWLRVVKSSGFLVITVPDWDLYEHRHWPSKFNVHHTSWTTRCFDGAGYPAHVIHVPSWLMKFDVDIEMLQLLTEHYRYDFGNLVDQTGSPAECAIEFIIRKR